MEKCQCGVKAFYACRSCRFFFCKEHKPNHELWGQGSHSFEKLGIKLSDRKIIKFVETISSKIKKINECEEHFIKETEAALEIIENICIQALKPLNKMRQNYANLLKICKKRLDDEQLNEINRQLRTSLIIKAPSYKFEDLKKCFTPESLQEPSNIMQISSVNVEDAKDFLIDTYGLFLEDHSCPITCVKLTSDYKYIILVLLMGL